MEPTVFYIGLYFLVSLLHLASSRVDSYGGWNNAPDTQYHIQTDEGEERYFKYQTKTGQYRKEKRLQDGTVVGTYGWVDPNGYLRLRDYVADDAGYRIVKTKMIYVGGSPITDKTVAAVKSYPTKYATLLPPSSTPLQNPFDVQSHRFAYVPPSTYHPAPPAAYFASSQTTPYQPLDNTHSSYYPQTQTTFSPAGQTSYAGNFESFVYQSTPASTYLRRPGEPSPLLQFFPSSTPVVDVSPNSLPKSSTPLYPSSTLAPTVSPFANRIESTPAYISSTPAYPSSTPSSVYLAAKSSSIAFSSTTPHPVSSTTAAPAPSPAPYHSSSSASPSVAVFSDPTPKPIAVYSSTPKPVAVNYVSSPSPTSVSPTVSPTAATPTESIGVIGYVASSSPPVPRLPPVAGKFLPGNNFITETEKNKLFFRTLGRSDYGKRYVDYRSNVQEYDGISTVQNGFRYFLPRHYHEEQSSSDGRDRAGSFGYIDPFGIRRVIYYNTSPGSGFVHRKNNRYVGFDATPYDPRPY